MRYHFPHWSAKQRPDRAVAGIARISHVKWILRAWNGEWPRRAVPGRAVPGRALPVLHPNIVMPCRRADCRWYGCRTTGPTGRRGPPRRPFPGKRGWYRPPRWTVRAGLARREVLWPPARSPGRPPRSVGGPRLADAGGGAAGGI